LLWGLLKTQTAAPLLHFWINRLWVGLSLHFTTHAESMGSHHGSHRPALTLLFWREADTGWSSFFVLRHIYLNNNSRVPQSFFSPIQAK
jgi:hypothetical protein